MHKTVSHSRLNATLIGFATTFVLIMMSSPVAGLTAATPFMAGGSEPTSEVTLQPAQTSSSAFVPEFFDGAGYGSTAETAVHQAIGDGQVTASAYGLYKCELVGEPEVFQQSPGSLRAFRAHVILRCTS